jgi:hypothetical protein
VNKFISGSYLRQALFFTIYRLITGVYVLLYTIMYKFRRLAFLLIFVFFILNGLL